MRYPLHTKRIVRLALALSTHAGTLNGCSSSGVESELVSSFKSRGIVRV